MTAAPLLLGRCGGAHWCEDRAAVSILTPALVPNTWSQHIASTSVWWTWRHGDMETWGHGDMGTWRHGDMDNVELGIITNRAARRQQRTSTRQLRHHTRGAQPRLGSQQLPLNTLYFTLITGGGGESGLHRTCFVKHPVPPKLESAAPAGSVVVTRHSVVEQHRVFSGCTVQHGLYSLYSVQYTG